MILYTIVPPDQLWAAPVGPSSPVMEIAAGTVRLLVQPLDPRRARIVRLISPNPNDFLRPQFQPGRILEFRVFSHVSLSSPQA